MTLTPPVNQNSDMEYPKRSICFLVLILLHLYNLAVLFHGKFQNINHNMDWLGKR